MAATAQFIASYHQIQTVINDGDTADNDGTPLILFTSTNGGFVTQLFATSTSSSAMSLRLYRGSSDATHFATINIPINAGNVTGTPPVDLLAALCTFNSNTGTKISGLPVDNNGNPILEYPASGVISVVVASNLGTGEKIIISGSRGEF